MNDGLFVVKNCYERRVVFGTQVCMLQMLAIVLYACGECYKVSDGGVVDLLLVIRPNTLVSLPQQLLVTAADAYNSELANVWCCWECCSWIQANSQYDDNEWWWRNDDDEDVNGNAVAAVVMWTQLKNVNRCQMMNSSSLKEDFFPFISARFQHFHCFFSGFMPRSACTLSCGVCPSCLLYRNG